MHCMMRVSKVVRVMMDDETVFPFKSLMVEPGRSWIRKAKAFKNAAPRSANLPCKPSKKWASLAGTPIWF